MQDDEKHQPQDGSAELYSVLRSGIKDLQDDRNFQTQRFQTLAIALGAAYGFISVTVDGQARPYFISISLILLNIGACFLAFFWHAQMGIFADAFAARYSALREVGSLLKLPVSPYDVDYEHRKKVEKAAKRWPKNTSELQNLFP